MNSIELEDIATIFASEFVKESKEYLMPSQEKDWIAGKNLPFLKMNYNRRRKIVEKVLDKIQNEL